MEKPEFEYLVREALESLPEWFAGKLENIGVFVEDEPPGRILMDMRIPRGTTLLGLYQGIPLDKRGFYYGNVLPDRVSIYMGPILRLGGTRQEIEGRIKEVVMHEIGHYFGLSDEDLRKLEEKG